MAKKKTTHTQALDSVLSNLKALSSDDSDPTHIFRRAFEVSPIGIAIIRGDGGIKEVNPSFSRIFGYAKSTLEKKRMLDLIQLDDKKVFEDHLRKMKAGTIDHCQCRLRFLDKEHHTIWTLFTNIAVHDKEKKLEYCVAQVVDITKNVHYEQELEQKKNEYQALAENTSDMISLHDAEGIYRYVNPASYTLLGYKPSEMIGKTMYEFFHPEDLIKIKSLHTNKKAHGHHNTTVDYRAKHKNGNYIWVQSRTRGIVSDGKLVSVVVVTRDMDDALRTMKVIEEKERQYRLLLDNLPLRVFYKNTQSIYQRCNVRYAHDLGIAPDDIAGKSDADFFPSQYVKKYQKDDAQVIKTGKRFEAIEDYLVGNVSLRVHTVKVPIFEDKKIIGLLGIFWDISQEDILQKENEKQIQQLEKLNKFFTNREIRMIELKKENEELRRKLQEKS